MRIGILGTGFGAYHASIYKKCPSVSSVKIFGRNGEKLGRIRAEQGIEVTDRIEDILDDPYIDLVDVCLPNDLHREYAVRALEKGKHVFCETPVSNSLEDALAIEKAGKQYGKKVFVNLFLRLDPPYRYAYEAVCGEALGRLKTIRVVRKTAPVWGDLGPDNIVTNLMIHDIDFITWLLGIPAEIAADLIAKRPKESAVNARLRYEDMWAEIAGSSLMPADYPFTVGYEAVFENGTLEYREEFGSAGPKGSLVERSPAGVREIALEQGEYCENVFKHVIQCCEGNPETVLDIKNAVASLKTTLKIKDLILAAYIS